MEKYHSQIKFIFLYLGSMLCKTCCGALVLITELDFLSKEEIKEMCLKTLWLVLVQRWRLTAIKWSTAALLGWVPLITKFMAHPNPVNSTLA
jgi:hypothetical protein